MLMIIVMITRSLFLEGKQVKEQLLWYLHISWHNFKTDTSTKKKINKMTVKKQIINNTNTLFAKSQHTYSTRRQISIRIVWHCTRLCFSLTFYTSLQSLIKQYYAVGVLLILIGRTWHIGYSMLQLVPCGMVCHWQSNHIFLWQKCLSLPHSIRSIRKHVLFEILKDELDNFFLKLKHVCFLSKLKKYTNNFIYTHGKKYCKTLIF